MGKISNTLLMLDYLNTGNKYTVKELAQKIGVTERMIKYYKDELEKAGIYIESFMGPGGGYFISSPSKTYTRFNKYDIQLLERAHNDLSKINFEYLDKYKKLIEKIKNISKIEEEKSKFISEIDDSDMSELLKLFDKYIAKREKIEIIYEDISGIYLERTIHPLQMFKYNQTIFITAFCELRNDIRHFELGRIRIK